MIFSSVLWLFTKAIMLALAVIPNLPALPSEVATASDSFIEILGNGMSILSTLFTPALLIAMIVVISAIYVFEPVYHSIIWIIKKIPMINLK